MYSVIIQNQKTMEAFSQYHPLFAEAISSNRIGVCKWIEAGTTLDTALPEIGSLTDDKSEWRAVIVRYIDDNCMASFETDPRNPYDFLLNREKKNAVEESPVPLIRLTQMLGGVPPLETEFKAEIIHEPHKAPRTIYVPVEDEQRKQAHRALTAKYAFDGKMPTSILLISLRRKGSQTEDVKSVWRTHKESSSSEFWKRNHFPGICRFAVHDVEKQGPIQKEADDFNFWYSVMLMAINEWDSSTLQAYRLYTIDAMLDGNAMSEAFQRMNDRLKAAKRSIEKSIRRDVENQIGEEEELPDYRIEIPVEMKLPKVENAMVRKSWFPFFTKGAATDITIWNDQQKNAEKKLADSLKTAERALDKTAEKMRASCAFSEEEVSPLSKYQTEDMEAETYELYRQIADIQQELPDKNVLMTDGIQEAAKEARKNLVGRVDKKSACCTLGLTLLLLAVSAVPACVKRTGPLAPFAGFFIGSAAVIAATAFFALLCQKWHLNALVERYNQYLRNAYGKLVQNADNFSVYMSDIASHSRGCSYLALSDQKQSTSRFGHAEKYKHMKAITVLLGRLKKWSKACHLDVDFASTHIETRVNVDTSIDPMENKLYSFATGEVYAVAINHSGMSMESPYPFANRIVIKREELYEDE